MNNSMINPPILELEQIVGDRYSLVVVTSKRARQLISGSEPLLISDSKKALTIAIDEVDQKKITFRSTKEGIK